MHAPCLHVQLAALLEHDCTEAMRWCLEVDRRHYKATWQLARALATRGLHEAAAAQLHVLFSTPRRGFALNMHLLEEKLPARVCPAILPCWFVSHPLAFVHLSLAVLHATSAWVHLPHSVMIL